MVCQTAGGDTNQQGAGGQIPGPAPLLAGASAPGRVGGVKLQPPVPHLPWSHPACAATTGANSRTAIPKRGTDELLKSTPLVSCACKSAPHADLIGTDDVSRTMNITLRRHRPKCAPGGRGISLRIRQGWALTGHTW